MMRYKKVVVMMLLLALSITNINLIGIQKVEAAIDANVVNEINITTIDTEYELLFKGGQIKVTLPVKVDNIGILNFNIIEVSTDYSRISASVYSDAACTKLIGATVYLLNGKLKMNSNNWDPIEKSEVGINKAGKYYVQFNLTRSAGTEEDYANIDDFYKDPDLIELYTQMGILNEVRFQCIFSVNALDINQSEDVVLSENNKAYYGYQDSTTEAIYYKVNLDKDGVLTPSVKVINPSGTGYIKITLLDKKKKEVIKKESLKYVTEKTVTEYDKRMGININHTEGNNSVSTWWALAKGTYYIKVETQCGIYSISSDSTVSKDTSGSTKKKAKLLKLKKTAYIENDDYGSWTTSETLSGICTPTDKKNKTDWYKFEISKPKDIYFEIGASSVGDIVYDICDSTGYSIIYGARAVDGSDDKSTSYILCELSGTYYLKVIKRDTKGYCNYSVNLTIQ